MPARDTSPNGRDRAREKDRDRHRDKPRSRDKDPDRSRDRERDRDRDRDRDRGGRSRDADRDRERDRKRDKATERDKRERYREPHDTGGRDRPARDRSRPSEAEPDSRRRTERVGDERARSHGARERDEGKRRDAGRERESDRGRERESDRGRERESDRGREREGEREKRARDAPEEETRERRAEKGGRDGENAARDTDRSTGARAEGSRRDRDTGAKEKSEKVERKPMTEEEIQVMQRRRRVEAWQKKKRAMEEAAARADEEAAAGRKKWTLEDDGSDDDEEGAPAASGHRTEGAMDVDEDDELERFMEGVGEQVKEDLLAIDPAVARDALEVNPQLARVGIHVSIPEPAVVPGNDTEGPADVDMADAGSAAAGQATQAAAAADGGAGEAVGVGDGDGANGAAAVPHAATGAAGEHVDSGGASAGAEHVAAAVPAAAGAERGPGDAAPQAEAGLAAAEGKPKVSMAQENRPVVQLKLKKPIAKLPVVAVKPGPKAYDKKRAKRLGKAQERRKKAIERAAPKALNPYASDSDDDAAPAAAPDAAAASDDEAAAAEEVEEELDDEAWAKAVQSGNLSKGERLVPVDHTRISYPAFRKAFYIESPDLARMTEGDVTAAYIDMGGVKVRGKDVPKPVRSWAQCGLPLPILGTLKRHLYREPLPIQALALPIIMSGRDCIGVATTGSGKTLGFVLPMLRHVNDQVVRGLDETLGNGPVGLIIAPTRELVQQISKEVRLFAKVMDLAVVAAYGGSGVKEQINGLKRGAHVVACTPGRMIDILVTSNGSITNLRRVTMLVIDEADRMFDMGFEPQISRIIGQIRPERQTVLFSATFPRQVEILARAILTDPIEVQVGGRSTVSSTIEQIVEIREDDDERFARLLEILGQYVESTKVLVFVNSQEKASTLFQQLLTYGYPNQMLHGDMQQTDRESVISDFKTGVCSVLVATSVAARGLDVRDLGVVVNYDTPNHLEEYVHRCGRTGRAGVDGTAITFLSPHDDQYAPDLVKAFRDSKLPIPADLQKLADGFKVKRKKGIAKLHGSGFGGSGFKFDQHEDDVHTAIKKRHAIEYRQPGDDPAAAKPDAASAAAHQNAMQRFDDGVGGDGGRITAKYATTVEAPPEVLNISEERMKQAQRIALQAASRVMSASRITENVGSGIRRVVPSGAASASAADTQAALVLAAQSAATKIAGSQGMQLTRGDAIKAAAAAQSAAAKPITTAQPYFEADLVINDFPQAARYHVTHRDTIAHIAERTGAAIIIRGQYYAPGQAVPPDDSKLFLLIEGPTMQVVKRAKELIKQIIEERTERSMRRDTGAMGRTSVV